MSDPKSSIRGRVLNFSDLCTTTGSYAALNQLADELQRMHDRRRRNFNAPSVEGIVLQLEALLTELRAS